MLPHRLRLPLLVAASDVDAERGWDDDEYDENVKAVVAAGGMNVGSDEYLHLDRQQNHPTETGCWNYELFRMEAGHNKRKKGEE